MFKKIKDFLSHISGVALIEFAITITALILFTAGSVDVYTAYNIKSKAQDVVQNIALGISKTDLSQATLDTSGDRITNMLAPYTPPDAAFRFDIQSTHFENGVFQTPITHSSGGLAVAGAFAPCTNAELSLPDTLNEGYADIISARFCVNPELVKPTIFGNLIGGFFSKDTDICHRVCALGQNSLRNHDLIQTKSTFMGGIISETLDAVHNPEPEPEAYATAFSCRLVITDIPRYGPCIPNDPICDENAFNYTPASFGTVTGVISAPPPNAGGAGMCIDPDTGLDLGGRSILIPPPLTLVRENVTVEVYNSCNSARNHDDIERGYAGADDTREPETVTEWDVYESVCIGLDCNCTLTGTESWAPKNECANWRIVDNTRTDLRDNGVFYTEDVCPHPRSKNVSGFGNQDLCTRVLVPLLDAATGLMSDTCNMSEDFVRHDDDTVYGMMDWNRMRREMYHYAGHKHGYDNGTGMQYFYEGYPSDVHGHTLESLWTHREGDEFGPRPPDGEHPLGGTNPIEGSYDDDREKGNPAMDGGVEMAPCNIC